MFAPDMSGAETGGYMPPGDIQDLANHPANMLPEPGHSPAMKHSTEMAGDVLPIRDASEYTPTDDKAIHGQIKNASRSGSNRTNVTPIKRIIH